MYIPAFKAVQRMTLSEPSALARLSQLADLYLGPQNEHSTNFRELACLHRATQRRQRLGRHNEDSGNIGGETCGKEMDAKSYDKEFVFVEPRQRSRNAGSLSTDSHLSKAKSLSTDSHSSKALCGEISASRTKSVLTAGPDNGHIFDMQSAHSASALAQSHMSTQEKKRGLCAPAGAQNSGISLALPQDCGHSEPPQTAFGVPGSICSVLNSERSMSSAMHSLATHFRSSKYRVAAEQNDGDTVIYEGEGEGFGSSGTSSTANMSPLGYLPASERLASNSALIFSFQGDGAQPHPQTAAEAASLTPNAIDAISQNYQFHGRCMRLPPFLPDSAAHKRSQSSSFGDNSKGNGFPDYPPKTSIGIIPHKAPYEGVEPLASGGIRNQHPADSKRHVQGEPLNRRISSPLSEESMSHRAHWPFSGARSPLGRNCELGLQSVSAAHAEIEDILSALEGHWLIRDLFGSNSGCVTVKKHIFSQKSDSLSTKEGLFGTLFGFFNGLLANSKNESETKENDKTDFAAVFHRSGAVLPLLCRGKKICQSDAGIWVGKHLRITGISGDHSTLSLETRLKEPFSAAEAAQSVHVWSRIDWSDIEGMWEGEEGGLICIDPDLRRIRGFPAPKDTCPMCDSQICFTFRTFEYVLENVEGSKDDGVMNIFWKCGKSKRSFMWRRRRRFED